MRAIQSVNPDGMTGNCKGEHVMNNLDFTHHHNQHNIATACPNCLSIHGHEPWCASCVPTVQYAFEILSEPRKLTLGDALILHSLGVTWSESPRLP
jgi:hypothetical protein